jgi:hypothetical protein
MLKLELTTKTGSHSATSSCDVIDFINICYHVHTTKLPNNTFLRNAHIINLLMILWDSTNSRKDRADKNQTRKRSTSEASFFKKSKQRI